MKVFVVYIMGDYAHAVGITQNYGVAKNYERELLKNGERVVWIEEVKLSNKLTELNCD